MKTARRFLIPAALLLMVWPLSSFADPLHKRIDFDVDGQFSMRMENYLLPAGHYVLFQMDQNNPDVFGLYLGDMTHPPIALINTTRIKYPEDRTPEHTRMLLNYAESTDQAQPVITGWTIPGDDGWEVVAVVPKNHSVLARVH